MNAERSSQAMTTRTCPGQTRFAAVFFFVFRPLGSIQKLVAGITGVRPKRTVDPDKAVALGAATYAGILEGEVRRYPFGFRVGLMNQSMESMRASFVDLLCVLAYYSFKGPSFVV